MLFNFFHRASRFRTPEFFTMKDEKGAPQTPTIDERRFSSHYSLS
jgi:hypothetical protein